MRHIRAVSRFAALLGTCLLIASLPTESILGLVGAVGLMAVGTVGCIESRA